MTDKWLEREIVRGLQGLIALRLSGAPADDSVTLTLDVWLAALGSLPVHWDEQLDTPRIRQAFRTLYRLCERWPAPKQFLDNLGSRGPPRSLPAPRLTEEQRKLNRNRLRDMLNQLSTSKRMTGDSKE